MSTTTPSGERLDQDTPDTIRLVVQAMGLLAGAALARGQVQDYGFLFIAFDPGLLIPVDQFTRQVSELIERLKATPRQSGVEGIVLARKVVEALNALASS